MGRRIEIEITEEIYSVLMKVAEEYGVSIEDYISLKVEAGLEDKGFKTAKKLIIKELQDTIKKVEAIKYEGLETENKGNKILIYSYNSLVQSSNDFPKEILKRIELYKEKGWFDPVWFYVIVCRKDIVGLIGMNQHEEAMPYGRYLFIYGLYLDKTHQTKQNLSYLSGYIQAVAKQAKIMNIDVCNAVTNLSSEGLKGMGFHSFSSTCCIEGILKSDSTKEAAYIKRESITLTAPVLENYLLPSRTLPLKLLMEAWGDDKAITSERIVLRADEGDELSYILIKEEFKKASGLQCKYTILVSPIDSFDIVRLQYIYKNVIYGAPREKEASFINICLPMELEDLGSHFLQPSTGKIDWYRKVLTS